MAAFMALMCGLIFGASQTSEASTLTVAREGVFRIDLKSLLASPLSFPEDLKSSPAWEFFNAEKTVWLLRQPGFFNPKGTGDLNFELWRMGEDGTWSKKISGLDRGDVMKPPQPRRRLETARGLWLGGDGSGLWLVPADGGAAVNLGWEKRFPINNPRVILAQGGDRLLVAGGRQSCVFDASRALELTASCTGSLRVATGHDLTRSADGTLFSLNYYARVLRQWTDMGWRDIPFGDDMDSWDTRFPPALTLGADSQNRIWIIPGKVEDSVARIWNVSTQTWDEPRPYLELIATAAKNSAWHFLFSVREPYYLRDRREAVFDKHGRAMLLALNGGLWCFDGARWSTMTQRDFSMAKNFVFYELQNDDANGDILVRTGEKTWYRLATDEHWILLEEQEHPSRRAGLMLPLTRDRFFKLPDAVGVPLENVGVASSDGGGWLVHDFTLNRYRGKEYLVPWPGANEPSPFRASEELNGVMRDSFGRLLFFGEQRSIIAVTDHLPAENFAPTPTDVEVTRPLPDGAQLRFTGVLADGDNLRWRRIDADWGMWGRDMTLTVNNLPPGEYVVEMQKMDKWLNISPSTEIKFSINYDSQ
jgi:hypothetical protein